MDPWPGNLTVGDRGQGLSHQKILTKMSAFEAFSSDIEAGPIQNNQSVSEYWLKVKSGCCQLKFTTTQTSQYQSQNFSHSKMTFLFLPIECIV